MEESIDLQFVLLSFSRYVYTGRLCGYRVAGQSIMDLIYCVEILHFENFP